MDDPRLPSPDDEPAPIADAEALFRDDPRPEPPSSPTAPTGPVSGESYAVEEHPPAPAGETPPIPALRPAAASAKAARAERPARPTLSAEEAVSQVWTRMAEWGVTLLVLGATALVLGLLIYGLLSAGAFSLAFLVLLVGGLVWVVLSYPILITLERPVRVTPEQAVNDFFGALSHHLPHFRRMWLLLSDAGKYGGSFATFEGFRNYWKDRLAQLRGGRASPLTPLKFVVEGYKSEKSAGRTDISASFTVQVFVRGKQDDGPIETLRVETTLVKGPDRMWYLDRGTLP
jgi:hypothetical protein